MSDVDIGDGMDKLVGPGGNLKIKFGNMTE